MSTATADAPAQTKEQEAAVELTDAEMLKVVEAASPTEANEKYPGMTNEQVAVTLRYKISREGYKSTQTLTDEQALLLRNCARIYPKVIDNRTAVEKKALGNITKDELVSDEERKRFAEKPGLVGLARYLWVTTGKATAAQETEARAKGKGKAEVKDKPKRESKPKGYRHGTFQKFHPVDDPTGAFVWVCKGDPLKDPVTYVGRWEDAEFEEKAKAAIKRKGFDPDTVTIVTMRARYAWKSEPAAAETA